MTWCSRPFGSRHPDAVNGGVEQPEGAGHKESGRVVGLGAICDIRASEPGDGRTQSFSVSEYAQMDDGRRVILHHERGFTIGSNAGPVRELESAASLTQTVLNVVLPDEDDTAESHPWAWLAELAQLQGLAVTTPDLRELEYEVVLTEAVTSWLAGS